MIQDSGTRELLHRLRLAVFGFSKNDIKAVAAIQPSITEPLGRFEQLRGPWIQKGGDSLFRVSPLISKLQVVDLSSETQEAVCWVLGSQIMARMRTRKIDQWEAHQALLYYLKGHAHQKAATVLVMILQAIVKIDGPVEDAGLMLIWSDQSTPLPKEVDLGLKIALRGLQVCMMEKLGKGSEYLLDDLKSLSEQVTAMESWGLFSAVSSIMYPFGKPEKSFEGGKRLSCGRASTARINQALPGPCVLL